MADEPSLLEDEHDCSALATAYSGCMRHRRDRQHFCKGERHDYLLCMTGRWAVHPERHESLARLYGERFATEVGADHHG